MHALAAGEHRKGLEAHLSEDVSELEGGGAHRLEVEPDVGIEIEDEPVGLFDIFDARAPAMDLDRAHLDAGQQALGRAHIEISLIVAIFLLDRARLDLLAERTK